MARFGGKSGPFLRPLPGSRPDLLRRLMLPPVPDIPYEQIFRAEIDHHRGMLDAFDEPDAFRGPQVDTADVERVWKTTAVYEQIAEDHPRLVRFNRRDPFFGVPILNMPSTTLEDFLDRHKSTMYDADTNHIVAKYRPLIYQWALLPLHLISGLSFVHSKDVLLGFLDAVYQVPGFSKRYINQLGRYEYEQFHPCHKPRWDSLLATTQTDLFVWGCLIYELMTGSWPGHERQQSDAEIRALFLNRRQWPLLETEYLGGVVRKCWDYEYRDAEHLKTDLIRYLRDEGWEVDGDELLEIPIEEADLYEYQRYRWLSREAEKLAVRYRKFKLPALFDAAVNVTGVKEAQCIKVLKCVEGQYNKALILTMSTGQEIVARLPNPNAGPAFYTTASEVATRQFLRDRLGIPIPRIYAWSAEESNAVGAEYILEEKATGQPLGSLWDKLPLPSRLDIVKQIVDIETKLASIVFPMHGCIYYQSDLESRQAMPSFALIPDQNPGLPNFAIGPLTHPKYWQGKRALMELDRGPWNSIADYAIAVGKNEIQWAEEHAQPRMNFQRSPEEPETPSDYISLLQRYTKLAPFLVPPSSGSEQTITISHPDLHLDNIFVDPRTNHITSIIDWQHASASPIFLQRSFPQMLELSRNQQAERQVIEKRLLEFYSEALRSMDPFRWKVLSEPFRAIRTDPISLVPCCWDREDLFSLRNAMVTAVAHWDEISNSKAKCPVEFTEKELEQHQSEMELIEGVSLILHQLHDDGLISLGGMVPPERYEDARKWNDYFKQEFINLAGDEKQKELHAKVWPYQ
ncbi:hypothetical protein CDV55_103165 [Aspergillus turcosus]|uniref:Altered inheritance of mitochondria protein 9, mitochondrial n=1 Tax=Aspergillus turcosus TaxID=1245748 RepID=A0A229XCB1_9EURO|nr:hypothetical protein CDV55_103165 [Aspergillus turcosus]RLL96679.1 hypothetical protein CFD26_106658 [Aspergillus turcosus]